MRAVLGNCYADDRCPRLPVVRWHPPTCGDFGGCDAVRLCQVHLDLWLDTVDDNEKLEPVELTWLADGKAVA